ncbi:hypothetical protein MHB54_00690 [Paenibacillus sp. FSL M7-0802]|uniref:hypothetical protein n=1 Tax=Paenibacillus sp. FSL M7-0802 TaxID=2921536 RepID=UPI0030F6BD02
MGITRDTAINILKQENAKAKNNLSIQPITRLKFINTTGDFESVDDFSLIVKRGSISEELQDALKFGQTLTTKLQAEYDSYVIEKIYAVVNPAVNETALNKQQVEDILRVLDFVRGNNRTSLTALINNESVKNNNSQSNKTMKFSVETIKGVKYLFDVKNMEEVLNALKTKDRDEFIKLGSDVVIRTREIAVISKIN